MKLRFLGTGTSQGVPVIACECAVCASADPRDSRLRTSVLIESASTCLVIDSGPDFRQQMLREKVKSLDAVVFTHSHKDHTAGLDDIRAYNFRLQQPMNVWGDKATLKSLKQEFAYIFENADYPGVPQVRLHEIQKKPVQIGDIHLQPIPVLHHKMPVLGFRCGNMAYITDANYIPEESRQYLYGLDILILNALRKEPHISHFNLEQALAIVAEFQPKQAYFTHISHLLGHHASVSRELPAHVALAWDGLSLDFH